MRPTVTYKGWSVWGEIIVPRPECPYVKKNGNYTCMVRDGYGQLEIYACTACAARLPTAVRAYFINMHNLLIKSGM